MITTPHSSTFPDRSHKKRKCVTTMLWHLSNVLSGERPWLVGRARRVWCIVFLRCWYPMCTLLSSWWLPNAAFQIYQFKKSWSKILFTGDLILDKIGTCDIEAIYFESIVPVWLLCNFLVAHIVACRQDDRPRYDLIYSLVPETISISLPTLSRCSFIAFYS